VWLIALFLALVQRATTVRDGRDRGEAHTVAIVQTGVWFHARTMALAAAESGVREGRIAASAQVGADAAQDYLDQVANGTFTDVVVSTAGSTAAEVQVTVTGSVPSLFPGLWPLDVSQSARGPVEAPR